MFVVDTLASKHTASSMKPGLRGPLALCMLIATLALPGAPARAGMVYGPYLVWMNLAGDPAVDAALHDYTHAVPTGDRCWNSHALLIAGNLPDGLVPELVRKAVVAREPAARKHLLAILKRGDGDIESFDGIVVVIESGQARLASLAASGRIRSRTVADNSGRPDWPGAFCDVLPPISRKP